MNLNDFFSKPSHVKEAYTNNYPSYTPAADATAAVSSGKAIDDPDIMGSLKGADGSGFDRLSKNSDKFDFRTGLGDNEPEVDADPKLMVEPNKYMQSWGGKFATQGIGGEDTRFTAPAGWRYVLKGEDPAISSREPAAAVSPPSNAASAGGSPKMKFDWGSRSLVPVDQSMALDLSPKNSDIKTGANPNIDAATRDRARAWAAQQNAPGADLAGAMRYSGEPVDTKAAPAPVTLKDLPVEKPSSWKDIAQANNIANPNRIMPGQVLKIPGKADYVVQPGDTLSGIAAGQTKAPTYTPTAGDTQPAAVARLKKDPNLGLNFPLPLDVKQNLGLGRGEELLTPAIIKAKEKAAADIAKIDAKTGNAANRRKTNEDDIDDQTQVSSVDRDWSHNDDHHYSSTSFQQDPNNPANNAYMNQQDHNGVSSTTYARNVTPKWMSNLKATAGVPGAEPAAQPPSQYPTQAGQGMNNRPFAAYSTAPGRLEVTRESLDRMQSLAGINKK